MTHDSSASEAALDRRPETMLPWTRRPVAPDLDLAETEDDLARERALRVGLEEFELDEEDQALLDSEWADDDSESEQILPVLAIIGRPNVGKSTLVNRILGRREAVVEDTPGRHPRPGHLPGGVGRPPVHARGHRRLGARRRAASTPRSPSRPSSRSTLPTP